MKSRNYRTRRKGSVVVLTAFMMVAMFAMLAFAVDIGFYQATQTQLQRTADAAAIAATGEQQCSYEEYGDDHQHSNEHGQQMLPRASNVLAQLTSSKRLVKK